MEGTWAYFITLKSLNAPAAGVCKLPAHKSVLKGRKYKLKLR